MILKENFQGDKKMIVFIYTCILALNLIAVLLTYHFLGKEMDKKSKGIFIVVGIAIIYALVSFVYWMSTKNIDLGESGKAGQNLITFTFVPVNAIIILPFLANAYRLFQEEKLKSIPFRNRCIVLVVVLVILLIFEFFYFKDIQTGILNMLQNAKNSV